MNSSQRRLRNSTKPVGSVDQASMGIVFMIRLSARSLARRASSARFPVVYIDVRSVPLDDLASFIP